MLAQLFSATAGGGTTVTLGRAAATWSAKATVANLAAVLGRAAATWSAKATVANLAAVLGRASGAWAAKPTVASVSLTLGRAAASWSAHALALGFTMVITLGRAAASWSARGLAIGGIRAAVQEFLWPLLAYGTASATTGAPGSSAAVQLPDPSGGLRVRFYNAGSVLAFVRLGDATMAAAAATDMPIGPGRHVECRRTWRQTHMRAFASAAVEVKAITGP